MRQKRKLAIAMARAPAARPIGTGGAATEPQPDPMTQAARTGHDGHEKPKGCTDVDSAGNEGVIAAGVGAKYISTVCNGHVYVLSVDEATNPGTPVAGWVAAGGPRDVREATLASNTDDVQGGPVFVTVLTRSQEVWEGRCPNTRPIGTCTFTQLPDPPQ